MAKRGFTLIELMVVVAIIGILMAAGIVAFSNSQRAARDAARIADLNAIGYALEQYYQDNHSYPTLNADSNNAAVIAAIGTYFPSGRPPDETFSVSGYRVRSDSTQFCVHLSGTLDNPSRGNCTGGSTICT